MGADQPVHWLILLILAGLLFGGYKRLPEMARSAGRSMRVFKTELKGLEDDDQARTDAAQATGFVQPVAPAQTASPVVVPSAQPMTQNVAPGIIPTVATEAPAEAAATPAPQWSAAAPSFSAPTQPPSAGPTVAPHV